MIKMKKILYLIIVTLIFSCTDSILDKKPVSDLPGTGFYKTMDDARAGVYGIYDAAQSVFRINFAYWGEGRADNVKTQHSGEELNLLQNNLNETLGSANWTNLYTMISRANYAIKYIPSVGNDEGAKQLLGQAHALRAVAYFYLVRIWGDVPLVEEPYISTQQEIFISKSDKELVWDLIEKDLEFASENCVDRFNNNNDRIMFTKGAADAFLTKVYLWRGKLNEADQASQRVLNNSLYALESSMDDWSKIFIGGYSKESIFEIGYDETDQTNALRILYAIGSDAIYTPSERFMNSYEEGDLRIPYIYDITQEEPKAIWKFLGKGVSDESASPSDQNIVLIRLADIMLLRAEILSKIGGENNITEAIMLLNKIRNRAGLVEFQNIGEVVSEYSSLENAILHERSIELSFEGHRWLDLVRINKAISTMGPINGLSDVNNIYWPISQTSLNKNPNLEQNEYYK